MSAPQPGWCHACQHTVNLVQGDAGPTCPSCGSDFVELVSPAYAPPPPASERPFVVRAAAADDHQPAADGLIQAVLRSFTNPDPPLARAPAAADRPSLRSGTLQLGPFSLGWQAMPLGDLQDMRPATPTPHPNPNPNSSSNPSSDPSSDPSSNPEGRDQPPRSPPLNAQQHRPEQARARQDGLPRTLADFMDDLGRRAAGGAGGAAYGPYTFIAPGGRAGGTGDAPPPPRDDPISRLMGFMAPFTPFGDLGALQESWEEALRSQGGAGDPPASEQAISHLPTFTLADPRRAEAKNPNECPICTDEFCPPSSSSNSSPPGPDGQTSADGAGAGNENKNENEAEPETPMAEGFDPSIPSDQLMLMPCGHLFHATCLVPWLKMHNTCPVCRSHLPDDRPERSLNTPFSFFRAFFDPPPAPPRATDAPANTGAGADAGTGSSAASSRIHAVDSEAEPEPHAERAEGGGSATTGAQHVPGAWSEEPADEEASGAPMREQLRRAAERRVGGPTRRDSDRQGAAWHEEGQDDLD